MKKPSAVGRRPSAVGHKTLAWQHRNARILELAERGLTHAVIAERTGVNPGSIGRILQREKARREGA